MPTTLYLDAARMGRMAPSAQRAFHDFVRLAGEESCSLYFERFLRDGYSAWPVRLQRMYPGLCCWGGIRELKHALARFVGLPDASQVLLASRSSNLMKIAARMLVHGGRTTLITDLTWPSYQQILRRAARQWSGRINRLSIRAGILSGNLSASEIVDLVARRVQRMGCQGVFLPAISHDGIRLPIAEICQAIRRFAPGVVIAIDGSQAMGQAPIDLGHVPCDMFFGGCHKWIGGHLPLGVAFFPRWSAAPAATWECLRDPLSSFLQGLESLRPPRFTETVNVSPLLSCRGALEDLAHGEDQATAFQRRRTRAGKIVRIGQMAGWTPLRPDDDFHSAAILLQATSLATRKLNPHELRERFHDLGVAATCYRNGVIRLSAPARPLSTSEAGALIQALVLVQIRATRSLPQAD